MKQDFTALVWREGDLIISQCREIEMASQGATEEEALAMLREALELHFVPPVATMLPVVRKLEVDIPAA